MLNAWEEKELQKKKKKKKKNLEGISSEASRKS